MNTKYIKRYNTLKCFSISLLTYTFAKNELATSEFCVYHINGKEYDPRGWAILLIIISIVLYWGFENLEKKKEFWNRFKKADTIKNHSNNVLYSLMLAPLISLVLLYLPVYEFFFILLLNSIIAYIISNFHADETESASAQLGYLIEGNYPGEHFDPEDYDDRDPFDDAFDNIKKKLKDFFDKYETIAEKAFFVLFVLGAMACYAYFFFPLLPQSIGGGKLEPITYVTNDTIVSGKKIYETENFVFVYGKDSSIIKLDWSEINKIAKRK